jgi:3-deoxy-manno-octulosonate cytidylyltransferase (CMP-KDO synthetase)
MLAPLAGMPLVAHTCRRAAEASLVDEVILATDDARVRDAVVPFGVRVVMTRSDHASGTDRIAEVVRGMQGTAIVVNVQGDEPMIHPETIDAVARVLLDRPEVPMATACRRMTDPVAINDPNNVKVVRALSGDALYFSRLPVPYVRDAADAAASCHWHHYGIYAYRRDFLLHYATMPQTLLEMLEKLEQLRVLENGHRIAVVESPHPAHGVDTPEELERVRVLMEGNT